MWCVGGGEVSGCVQGGDGGSGCVVWGERLEMCFGGGGEGSACEEGGGEEEQPFLKANKLHIFQIWRTNFAKFAGFSRTNQTSSVVKGGGS